MNKINWQNIFIFLFLIIFPFGQIIRINIFHPIDIVVGLAAIYSIINKLEKPKFFKNFKNTLFVVAFSFIFSIFVFWNSSLLIGFLYLLRLTAYFYFLIYVWNFAKVKENRKLLTNSLLSVSVVSAIFGWIQYFTIPDIKPFFTFGWDEHLFRLVGTFLDPAFLGLIIVFGLLISINKYLTEKNSKFLFLAIFLLISLAFTYSRSSYLSLVGGISILAIYYKKIKEMVLVIAGLIILVFLLPTTQNHSIEFFRTFSILSRGNNYLETIQVFKSSPVFGIGFNNMCQARQKFIGPESFSSHACSGSDSSALLILATTGVLGLLSFVYLSINVWRQSDNLSRVLLVSLLIHTTFSNSLFYPWIIGYIIIMIGISLRSKTED